MRPDGSLEYDSISDESNESSYSSVSLWKIRLRNWLMTPLQLLSISMVLIGAWNLIAVPVGGPALFDVYRVFGTLSADGPAFVFYLGDIIVIAVGSAFLWLLTR